MTKLIAAFTFAGPCLALGAFGCASPDDTTEVIEQVAVQRQELWVPAGAVACPDKADACELACTDGGREWYGYCKSDGACLCRVEVGSHPGAPRALIR
jgi:hypothetical protein